MQVLTIGILFVCHGRKVDIRELAVIAGQNGANHGIWDGGVLRVRKRKTGNVDNRYRTI